MKDIFYLSLYYPQIMCLNFFPQRMLFEIVFNKNSSFFLEIIHIFTYIYNFLGTLLKEIHEQDFNFFIWTIYQ